MDAVLKTKYMQLAHEVDAMVRAVKILIEFHVEVFGEAAAVPELTTLTPPQSMYVCM
jgi:hypothetical protein